MGDTLIVRNVIIKTFGVLLLMVGRFFSHADVFGLLVELLRVMFSFWKSLVALRKVALTGVCLIRL